MGRDDDGLAHGAPPGSTLLRGRQRRQVLTSCESTRHYRYVVLHTGLNGTFATFHRTLGEALRAKTKFWVESAPTKQIVAPLVTATLLPLGTRVTS